MALRPEDDSTLWPVSAYERMRDDSAAAALTGDTRRGYLPTTLLADLHRLRSDPRTGDVLEVIAACLRHREPALLYLDIGGRVWPVSIFPPQRLYHAPRSAAEVQAGVPSGFAATRVLDYERPGLRPPGHFEIERVGDPAKYHPLSELLWPLALHGPRGELLAEIGGRSAYRLAAVSDAARPRPPGALAPAVARLREGSASLRDIARWPGMSVERAGRLLNGLYLNDALLVSRVHPAAREEPRGWRQWFGRKR